MGNGINWGSFILPSWVCLCSMIRLFQILVQFSREDDTKFWIGQNAKGSQTSPRTAGIIWVVAWQMKKTLGAILPKGAELQERVTEQFQRVVHWEGGRQARGSLLSWLNVLRIGRMESCERSVQDPEICLEGSKVSGNFMQIGNDVTVLL